MRMRRKRNITIGILCCMLVFMGIGYAALQQVLTINATGNVTGAWKIEITSITPELINEGESVSTSIADSKTEGSFEANLKKPTDGVIYTVTVENKGTIDAVLESITPEDYSEGDIKYTTSGKEDCKTLGAGDSCNFTIKVEYVDTGIGQQPTPNGTKVSQDFIIKYVQEGAGTTTPGGGNGGGSETNTPAITVDSEGLVTGYDKEKLTNDEGYVVIPATTADGEEITSIDQASFMKYNVSSAYIYNETTDEEIGAIVIYDEENYEELENTILKIMSGGGEDSGSGSYSSNSFVLEKDINPSNLVHNKKSILLEKLSGSGSGEEEMMPIYSKTEFEEILKEMQQEGSIEIEYGYIYIDLETGEFEEASSEIEKLDLTQATNLKTIDDYAFAYSPLTEIKFSNSIEKIGEYAFEDAGLTSIELPANLKTIGKGAFANNSIEGTLVLPDSLQVISENAFSSNIIEKILFSKKLLKIEDRAFSNNQIKGTLVIPDSVIGLGGGAFQSNQISRIEFGKGLTSIGENAFARNQLSEGIKFSESIKTIGNQAFYNSQLSGEIIIPASLEVIECDEISYGLSGAFSDNQITKVTFEEGTKLKKVGRRAFSNNPITSVDFPVDSEIEVIDYAAFYGAKITDLEIPSNIVTIGESAFYNIYTLKTLTFASDSKLQTIGRNAFECADSSYNTEAVITSITIPASVKTIQNSAFSRSNVEKIIFENTPDRPSQLTTIGSWAFRGNEMYGELIIPASVKEIQYAAFAYNDLTSLVFEDTTDKPSQLTTIEASAFLSSFYSSARGIKIVIPSSVVSIGGLAFSSNSVSQIIVKRADSTGMTLEDNWFGDASVQYNPNYIG